jgi:hypothetical protein
MGPNKQVGSEWYYCWGGFQTRPYIFMGLASMQGFPRSFVSIFFLTRLTDYDKMEVLDLSSLLTVKGRHPNLLSTRWFLNPHPFGGVIMRAIVFCMALSIVLLSTVALADVPGLISYQGTLTDDSGAALDTTVSMTFAIYTDSTGGGKVWFEIQPAVVVSQGLFNVMLGRVNPIPDTVFDWLTCWLSIKVGSDPELVPRQRIASTGYSFRAAEADTADYARSATAASDEDWTISGPNIYSAVGGNVGIGTTSPAEKLHVNYGNIQISGDDDYNLSLLFDDDDTGKEFSIVGHDQLKFKTNGTDRLTISSSGNVGIGTLLPAEKLHINYGSIQISGDDDYNLSLLFDDDDTGNEFAVVGHEHLKFSTNGTARLTITPDGNVGIGTTTPAGKLQVVGSGGDYGYMGVSGYGVFGGSSTGHGVYGASTSGYGVYGSHGGGNYGYLGSGSYGAYGGSSTGRGVYGASTSGYGVYGTSISGSSVHGEHSGGNFGSLGNGDYGVYGYSNSINAVRGYHTSGNYGYLGSSSYGAVGSSSSGNGVRGISNGSGYGVDGYSFGGYGVYGSHSSGSYGYLGSGEYGVYGRSGSINAVRGYHTSGSYGYLGSSSHGVVGSSSGGGVRGISNGSGYGVDGYSFGGYGVYGSHSSGSYGHLGSSSYGVYGHHFGSGNFGYLGSSNYGVYGWHSSGSYGYLGTDGYGVRGYCNETSTGTIAAYGYHGTSTAGTDYYYLYTMCGVYGRCEYGTDYHCGVQGATYSTDSGNRTSGVHGRFSDQTGYWGSLAYKTSTNAMYGGYFTSRDIGPGKGLPESEAQTAVGLGSWGDLFGADIHGNIYGIYVEGGNYGLYSHGTVFKDELDVHLQHMGDKSSAVLYTNVSTDVTVQTSGFSTLSKGACRIAFDDDFKRVVSPDMPVIVTVTPTGNSNGVYVSEVTKDGFSVVENNGGKSSVTVTFIAIGRRAGYESPQLPQEVISSDYVVKLSRGLHNDADTETDGEGLYYQDGQLYVGLHPSVLPDPQRHREEPEEIKDRRREMLEAQERDRREREKMEQEHRKVLALQREESLERERMEEEARRVEEEHRKRLEAGEEGESK